MLNKMLVRILVLIFMNCVNNCMCFDVNFKPFYDAQLEPFNTQIQKREMAQFFDKAAYSFNGLDKVQSVPVPFPIDICILSLEGVKYAASLHRNKNGVRHFTVYKNVDNNYHELHSIAVPNATAIDCKSLGAKGYIALALNITQTIENARDGSPILVLTADDRLRAVQFFATKNLYSVYLRTTANDLFMLQTLRSSNEATNPHCPYYKWSGTSFTLLARLPCSNARHIEPFAINYENYVALANYADQRGRTTTYSEIYKFVRENKRFQLFQKIRTYGAVDVRYFSAPLDEVKRRHFLVFGNSVSRSSGGDVNEADSIFYVFDKGQFVPYQSLSLYAVEQFLPVQNADAEKFLLLVACKDQDTKIYNLNDWKFEQSNVQFTEGALGRGVSKMRIHQESEKSYLVIANEMMTENDTNIFLPIFKQDEHANALRQQIIDWTKMQIERLAQIDVNKLQKEVEQKLAQNQRPSINTQVHDIPKSNIQTVTTNSFVYPKHHFTTHYWQALNLATQALNGIEAELKSNVKRRLKRDSNTTESIPEFANLKVDTLVVKQALNAEKVNGVDAIRPTFDQIRAIKVRVTRRYQATERTTAEPTLQDADDFASPARGVEAPEMVVKNLLINGSLNEHKWSDLLNNTLKREGVEYIKQPAHIVNLIAESVRVLNDEIDGNSLKELIPIDFGVGKSVEKTFEINQSVLFEGPVKAKELHIRERLNHIPVRQDKLEVLLKHVNTTQMVEGEKRFENVRILQPIAMAGQMLGARLQSLSSRQIIHDDLILNGDYTIKGDAIISDLLTVDDLIDENSRMSTKHSLMNGLDITQPLENVNIRFEQPVEANNTQLTFINAVDMQQLVKTNFKGLQVIEGEKHFKQTLTIHRGFTEVKYLNGVDVEKLNERLLLKSVNQSIKVPMHFGHIETPDIVAPSLMLKDKPLDAYVTRTGAQHLPVTLTVAELSAQTLNLERLHANGHIFGKSVLADNSHSLMAQLLSKRIDILPPQHKFPNTIFVGNLRLSDGSINGRRVRDVEKQLQHLNDDIHFEGNYKFNYDMNISHLSFQGKFNDIPAEEFGRSWLQKSGTQVFTASQSFSEVDCSQGVQLDGSLNGYEVDDFYTKTYWINRDEYIDDMEFQNPIQMQAPLSTTTLNGVHVPLDIIHANSTTPQILYNSASIHGHLNVIGVGGVHNVSALNGINLAELQRFLKLGYDGNTLHVEHASFEQAPLYHTLNHYELSTVLDKVWLTNENVRLKHHVELANVTFEGLLDFEGPVNNLNLHYLKENYLSLSRSQNVATELILANDAKFEGDLTANNVQLNGLLVESRSDLATNFDEFVANTLKSDGPSEIRGGWSLVNALIQGDLGNVQINNLNLAQDVLRLDMPCAPITAPKHIKAANIQKLYTAASSTIQGVPIANWMQSAVYVHGNHTINGNTTLNTVNMYNDLRVLGTVNDISKFGEKTLMLRNIPKQILHGDLYINNLLPKDGRILINSFENLRANSVNGEPMDEFFAQYAKISRNVTVEGNLVFMQPAVAQQYLNRAEHGIKSKRSSAIKGRRNHVSEMPNWNAMFAMAEELKKFAKASYNTLDGFDIAQTLAITATELVHIKLSEETDVVVDVIGAIDENNKTSPLQYYQWSQAEKQFYPMQGHLRPTKKTQLTELITFLFSGIDCADTTSEIDTNYQLSNLKNVFKKFLKNKKLLISKPKPLTIEGEPCFRTLPTPEANITQIYCINGNYTIYEKFLIPRRNIKELQVSGTTIAVLLPNCVEIWTIQTDPKLVLRLPTLKSNGISSATFKNETYLAIHTDKEINSLHNGSVDIYIYTNSTHLNHMQRLDCLDCLQISLNKIELTGDLLLFILTQNTAAPLLIYQYKGVLGFQQIVGASTLPTAISFWILNLENSARQMIALLGSEEISFVEITMRKF
ncbi:uncharacterized protein LOC101460460 isoform X2 [Ceratitis capitata]|uniref:uncharacterized protein LOC101460460 isoform X2 n=1 Tax=Ceratitis capitata TaxID=7213 RepID=UPI0006187EB2|nr:uncharacterized protein LOC101460460 isoform X2 [Ceratitis capitata]